MALVDDDVPGGVHGAWRMVHGAWCMVHGAWCMCVCSRLQASYRRAVPPGCLGAQGGRVAGWQGGGRRGVAHLYLNFFSRCLSFMMSSYVVSSTLKRHGTWPGFGSGSGFGFEG